jgi:hypothetical protein
MIPLTPANCPQTVIFEGDMSPEKSAHLRKLGAEILHAHRREATDSQALTSTLVNENRHPDLIEFGGESVLIGPEKDPQPGTVRHLLRKVLAYAPWKSSARVVIFQNAAGIKDEAETALLKTLEEPQPLQYFFLSVQAADTLKETIRSRAVITRTYEQVTEQSLPADPWQRFYYLLGARDFEIQYPEESQRLISEARSIFDEMTYTNSDFPALEKLLYQSPRQLFEKENFNVQARALKFVLLPLWAAVRDRATQGIVPPLSPITLSRMTPSKAIAAADLMQTYVHNLERRIFGNRPLNQLAVFYSFFFRFFPLWAEK